MKHKRLFVRSDAVTDGQWWYAGGPDACKAAKGVASMLETAIEQAFFADHNLDGLEFDIRELTDEEVEALPDAG